VTRLARRRQRALVHTLAERSALYAREPDPAERASAQLDSLNRVWASASAHVPYWRALRESEGLPARWESLEQFASRLPGTDKSTLQQQGSALRSEQRPPELQKMTGGSTAEPVQIPKWKSEIAATRANLWLGRGRYGIEPHHRLFMLWGHSHLLGTGVRGFVNARRQELADWLLGYCRFSAYDMRPEAMRRALERMLSFRPDYVLGYSVALHHLAEAAGDLAPALRALGLRAVIATAESFPSEASEALVAERFGCPVAMEYGAVETPGLAYSLPEGGYQVFWDSYLVEAERRGKRWSLRITALVPRCVPLLRYEIGDEVELQPGAPDHVVGLTGFERLVGRCNDYLELDDGARIHSEAISHAVRACAGIRSYQVVQQGRTLLLHYTAPETLPADQAAGLVERLRRIHPGLAEAGLERVPALRQTVAGKTPMILRS
jgi:phenylacetate-coenzyme A ligase PaaK-like adenylate-forming protein